MITVNFREMPWEDGLTVENLLQRMMEDQAYRHILRSNAMVIVNSEFISPAEYAGKKLADGDEMRIYPVMAGG